MIIGWLLCIIIQNFGGILCTDSIGWLSIVMDFHWLCHQLFTEAMLCVWYSHCCVWSQVRVALKQDGYEMSVNITNSAVHDWLLPREEISQDLDRLHWVLSYTLYCISLLIGTMPQPPKYSSTENPSQTCPQDPKIVENSVYPPLAGPSPPFMQTHQCAVGAAQIESPQVVVVTSKLIYASL